MPTLTHDDIADLVTGTLRELGRAKFQQIAQNLQGYEVMGKWLKSDKVVFDEGRGIQRNLMTKLGGSAQHKGLFEKDSVDVPDLMAQLNIPWRHCDTHWAFERRETLMNKGKALVHSIIKPRRAGAMIDMAEELESKGWALPGVSNATDPYGIPYYVVKNATEGFNGGAGSGHTTVAGINPTTTPKFKNYTYQYTTVDKPDLLKGMRTGHRKTNWKSPVDINDYRKGNGRDCRYYTNDSVMDDLEDIGEAQNENLGRDLAPYEAGRKAGDLAKMDGFLTFRRHPFIWVPQLDTDTQNPIYQIDHNSFCVVILKGDYMRETKPKIAANQHNTFVVFIDLSYNFLCFDRRRQAVYATA